MGLLPSFEDKYFVEKPNVMGEYYGMGFYRVLVEVGCFLTFICEGECLLRI
jgi:hypothetical protein